MLAKEETAPTAKANAAGALQNLALDAYDIQNDIVDTGAMPHVVDLLTTGSEAAQARAAGLIWCLAYNHNKIFVGDFLQKHHVIECLRSLTHSHSNDTKHWAQKALHALGQ